MAENRRKCIDASVIFRNDKEVILLTKRELQERRSIMNYGLLSLLPPVVAVILAIWSKNVILSLFCGGFVGAMIFCGGNPFAAVHSMIGDYFFIVYIGDSATDIPCMRLVKSKGGHSIGVFDPEKNKREKVYQLFNDGRINFYAPADYSEDSELFKYIKLVIGQISINEGVKTEQRTLKNPAETYNLYITMQSLADHMKSAVSPREYQKLQRELNKLQHQIEGI